MPESFNKVAGLHQACNANQLTGFYMMEACNFIKKEALAQVFSCEFCKISKNTFFTEHLWATAPEAWQANMSIYNLFLISIKQ